MGSFSGTLYHNVVFQNNSQHLFPYVIEGCKRIVFGPAVTYLSLGECADIRNIKYDLIYNDQIEDHTAQSYRCDNIDVYYLTDKLEDEGMVMRWTNANNVTVHVTENTYMKCIKRYMYSDILSVTDEEEIELWKQRFKERYPNIIIDTPMTLSTYDLYDDLKSSWSN